MSAWWTVCKKEIRENLRDRRTMISTFVAAPLFGPVLFGLLIAFIISVELERAEKPLELPVVGAEHAPNLIGFLKASAVEIKAPPADPEGAVRARDADVILRIPPDYPTQWRAGEPAVLELLFDRSQQRAQASIARVQALLEAYGRRQANLRLMVRGIDPDVLSPVVVVEQDLSTPQSRSGLILSMLPYLLIITVFAGGMYLAIDTTAGERERQSLEPLLINPVGRGAIMSGKLLATVVFALASLILTIAAFSLSARVIPIEKLDMVIKLGPGEGWRLFLICAPLALVGAALQVTVAAFSKSFREAQTYLTFLIFIPAIPTLVMAVNPLKPAEWMYAAPLVSQQLLIERVVRGETVELGQILLSAAVTTLLGVILALLAARLYHRESLAISV